MTVAEFVSWQHYYELAPFGPHIDDVRIGQLCSILANVNRDTKQRPKPFETLEFAPWNRLLQHEADEAEQQRIENMSVEERIAALDAAFFRF